MTSLAKTFIRRCTSDRVRDRCGLERIKRGKIPPLVTGYWGILKDWAELQINIKCYLGRNRHQVFKRIKMLLHVSF